MTKKYLNFNLIDNLFMERKFNRANEEIDALLKLYPENINLYKRKVDALSKLGRFKEAEEWIDNNQHIFKNRTENMKGVVCQNNGDVKKAIRHYKKAINLSPYDWNGYIKIAQLYEEVGDLDQAKNYYEQAINLGEKTYAFQGMSRIAVRERNFELAKHYLERIIVEGGKERFAANSMIDLAIFLEEYEIAYECLHFLLLGYSDINPEKIKKQRYFLEYKLGIRKSELRQPSYLLEQIVDYDEEKFYERNQNLEGYINNNGFKFTISEVDELRELLESNKDQITSKSPISVGVLSKYILVMPKEIGVSTLNDKTTNKLEVLTIANTSNIVSVYPIADYYSSYNDERKKEELFISDKTLIRTKKSQIDKFNERFSKKQNV